MAHKSGFSHAFAALVALLASPYLKSFTQEIVSTQDIIATVNLVAAEVARHPAAPLPQNTVSAVLYVGVVFTFVFAWGFAYHHKRH